MLQLVRGDECHSFKDFEGAGHWLLAQAGVKNPRVKRAGGMWTLSEELEEGSAILAAMSVDDPRPVQARLFQYFCEQWSKGLGFEMSGKPLDRSAQRSRLQRSTVQSYMISERAYIATFGY
jgi:hypothetical protein